MNSTTTHKVIHSNFSAVSLVLFIVLQFVMPKIGASVHLQFDNSCYSGAFKYFEKIGTGGSCGPIDHDFVGFPFVFNSHVNTLFPNTIVVGVNVLLFILAVGVFLAVYSLLRRDLNADKKS